MRYNYYNRFCKIVFAIVLGLPFIGFAQVEKISYMRPSYWRPYDQTGINVFETTKQADPVSFDGLRVRFGAGFTQQYQNLKHTNATALNNEGAAGNRLYPITPGFMTSQANLFMDVQLADGIRLNVTSYMSARHHNETWVKGGFIQIDKFPFKGKFWDEISKLTTVKIGHMEINYGDAHYRRSDGGQTLYNPFMDNNIMDEFATEIGGEVYVQKNGLAGMIGVTNGMIKGNVDSAYKTPQDDNTHKSPSIYGKLAYDKKLTDNVRLRVSGSYYYNKSAAGGLTIFGGDRTGSNYQNVMEKGAPGALPASTAIAFSGRFNPGFSKKLNAYMLNAFAKVYGFELFGTYEGAKGRTKTETTDRKAKQYSIDGVYRFGKSESLFLGLRYNRVKATLANTSAITYYTGDVTVNRFAFAGGWFLTKNLLLKGEVVNQFYRNFPAEDYRSGGHFKGYVIEATVGF
jgi:hypothetical protein